MRMPRFVTSGFFTSSLRGFMDRCALLLNLHSTMLGNASNIISPVAQNITESRRQPEILLNTAQDNDDRKTHTNFSVSA